jgi:hypothetical protein
LQYDDLQRRTLRNLTVRNFKDDLSYTKAGAIYKLAKTGPANKDATKRGTIAWSNSEVSQLLALLGLPEDSALSVLVVEFLPVVTNIYEAVSGLDNQGVNDNLKAAPSHPAVPPVGEAAMRVEQLKAQQDLENRSPVSDELGQRRILRTSPLTEVPFVCTPSP